MRGQINMSTTGSHTQNFNTLASSGSTNTWTDNSTITNWYSKRTGTGTTYASDAGSANGGNLYSYGTSGNSERALGSIGSSNAAAGSFAHGVLLRNTSGANITDIKVTYTLEEWRLGVSGTSNTITFWYKISSSEITNLNPNANSTWTQVLGLSLTSPVTTGTVGALDGNNSANRVTATNISIPSLTLANNEYIMLKWEDPDHTGTDHGLAIDDVTINWTISSSNTPPTLTADAIENNVDNNIDITFTEDATWRAAVTAVKIGGTALTEATDYVLSEGNLQLKPSGLNTLLTTSGSKTVTIEATGYSTASVTQQINAGAENKLAIKTQPAAPASNGAVLATQPAVYVQDQYGNTTTSTASVTATVGAGTWTIGGTTSVNGVGGTATFTDLTATSTAAITGATISFSSGSLTGVTSGTFDIPAPPVITPTITVTETTVPAMTAVVGGTPDTETINVEGTNLTGNISVTIDGTDASMFSVTTNPSPLTSVGGTTTIIYTPTAAGTHTATLRLNSTGATEVTRQLNGTATIPVEIPDIIINEVDADQTGVDAGEFIELFDGGIGNTSLNGFVVVLFNGSDDKSYAAYDLDGYSTDANGYFVIGSTGMGTDIELAPGAAGWLQNGADAVALYYDDATSFPNSTSVTTTNLVDALVYDTNDADDTGLLVLLNASQPQIDEAGRSSSDNHSMQRLPNGTGGARNTSTYDLTYPTPGAANVFREVTWTGATDTNWATTTNWTPNLVPDRGVNATIANVTNGVVLGAIGSVNNLTIAPNAKLTINSTLSVAGNLTIVSDATNGTGTLVDNGTLTVKGTTTVNQTITSLPRTYYAGIPVAVTSTTGITNVATFTESTDLWSALSTNTAGTMTTAGQGYLIQVPTESNISFNGSLNTGDKTVGLTIGKKTYNFLGNPYPSYLDGQKVVDATASVEKSIWYRTKTGASTYGFVTYNVPTGVSIPATAANNGFIPPMQGFWLKATAAGNYTFTNTMRTHNTTGTAIPLKAPQAAVNQILRLQVSNGTALDETVFLFNENAITGYDSYDASKMMNTGTGALNIYTVLGTENLALNSQPEITYGVEIPVGMNLAAGTYTISANEFSNFAEGTKAQLLDKATGTLTDLTTASYNFTLTEALNSNTRFALVFPQNAPTGVDNAGAGDVTVFTRSSRIVVSAGEAAQGSMIYVFNGVGQRLAAQAVSGTVNEIGRTFPAGVYVVKVNNVTAKVVVK